jgi:hypothetical protein
MASTCDFTISLSFVTPEKAESTETLTAAMPDGAKIVVNNRNGSTRVTVDPNATEATLEITRIAFGADQEEADALLENIVVTVTPPTAEDNTLRVEAPRPDVASENDGDFQATLIDDELHITGIMNTRRVAIVKLRITIPAGHAVEVTNYNGAVRAVDLDTASTLTSRNGSIRTIDATANLTIETNNGAIEVEGHRGSLDVETHNGRLEIEVRSLAADQQIRAETKNGMIRLELPSDIDAELSAETNNGLIVFREREFDGVTNLEMERRTLTATLNGGGPTIDVETHNGMIDIDGG